MEPSRKKPFSLCIVAWSPTLQVRCQTKPNPRSRQPRIAMAFLREAASSPAAALCPRSEETVLSESLVCGSEKVQNLSDNSHISQHAPLLYRSISLSPESFRWVSSKQQRNTMLSIPDSGSSITCEYVMAGRPTTGTNVASSAY